MMSFSRFLSRRIAFTVCAGLLVASFSLLSGSVFAHDPTSKTDHRIETFQSGLVALDDRGLTEAPRWSVEQRLQAYRVPGVALAIIENGEIIWAAGHGQREAGEDTPVDPDTVFSVGSISKIVNAALILRLAEEGLVDLDTDVNSYLVSWRVEDPLSDAEHPVTLRRILSHTAGFSQHGFDDYLPGEPLPTVLQILEGKPPAKNEPVRLLFAPGERMEYSGGGITVSQVLVEDVTGLDYETAARHYVFEPLGMSRSTFVNPLPSGHGNIAHAHDQDGAPVALPRGWQAMPEMAASGLWTSANDLARFVIALNGSARGTHDFLSQNMAQDMMSRELKSWHGLGPRLNGTGETRVFHHGGANDSYRAWIQGHLASGDGIVMLTNGTNGSRVYGEIRRSVEEAFSWPIRSETSFKSPILDD